MNETLLELDIFGSEVSGSFSELAAELEDGQGELEAELSGDLSSLSESVDEIQALVSSKLQQVSDVSSLVHVLIFLGNFFPFLSP